MKKLFCSHLILCTHGMGWSNMYQHVRYEDPTTFGSRAMATLILTQCTQNYAWGRNNCQDQMLRQIFLAIWDHLEPYRTLLNDLIIFVWLHTNILFYWWIWLLLIIIIILLPVTFLSNAKALRLLNL